MELMTEMRCEYIWCVKCSELVELRIAGLYITHVGNDAEISVLLVP
jgi:hypothetical protein